MTPLGSVSVSTTVVAESGPSLVIVIVYRTVSPSFGLSSSTDFSTFRSALWTVKAALSWLFPAFGSL